MKATLVYHLRSGRIVREPAGEVPDPEDTVGARMAALKDLAAALTQKGTSATHLELVPLITIVDDEGRDHLIPTAALEDVELVLGD